MAYRKRSETQSIIFYCFIEGASGSHVLDLTCLLCAFYSWDPMDTKI